MGNYLKKFPASLRELKNVRALAAIAMLLALRVVLGMFANATLPMFGNTVKLSAAFIPIAVGGAMFGPVPAALIGALGDVISFVIAPTGGGYFPGFTISGLLTGLVYGFALGLSTRCWSRPSSPPCGCGSSTRSSRTTASISPRG